METINWFAILTAGVSAFVLGGIWYSPALFGTAWMKDNALTLEQIKSGNAAKIYGWAFVLTLIAAANLGMFLADTPQGFLPVSGFSALWLFTGCLSTSLSA
jgi:hypothetical protein